MSPCWRPGARQPQGFHPHFTSAPRHGQETPRLATVRFPPAVTAELRGEDAGGAPLPAWDTEGGQGTNGQGDPVSARAAQHDTPVALGPRVLTDRRGLGQAWKTGGKEKPRSDRLRPRPAATPTARPLHGHAPATTPRPRGSAGSL